MSYIDVQNRYNVAIKLHKEKDADILLKLSGVNRQGYIKDLIRADLNIDQVKKMACCKCGSKSSAYIHIKRFDSESDLYLPFCTSCIIEKVKVFNG